MARKSSIHIKLTNEERFEPERRARSLTAPHRIVVRAKVILMLAEGQSILGTAVQVGRGRRIVHKWAKRFVRKPTGPANHLKRYLPRSMPRLRLLHSHSDSPERQQGLALRFPRAPAGPRAPNPLFKGERSTSPTCPSLYSISLQYTAR